MNKDIEMLEYKEPVVASTANITEAKVEKIDPKLFESLVNDISTVLGNFQNSLPAFEIMEATNPKAYEAIIDVIVCMINLSQILLENGSLKTDQEVAAENVPAIPSELSVNTMPIQ